MARFHLERWGVFLHPGLKIMGLTDLIFDVALMIIVVGEGVIHLCWREMRKLAQHFFDSEAEFMVPDDRTNRETGATNDGTTPTDSLFAFDVRVGCFYRSYATHTKSSPRTLPRGLPPRKPASFPDSSYAKRGRGAGLESCISCVGWAEPLRQRLSSVEQTCMIGRTSVQEKEDE